MYLSRIQLDVTKRKTQAALASPNKIHGAVEEAFSERQSRNLWRIDTLRGNTYLLILSAVKPDFSGIAQQFSHGCSQGESKDYEVLLNRIQTGSRWHFRLAANPVHSKKEGEGRGKVMAYVSEKPQLDWLKSQARKKGFVLVPDTVCVMGSQWKIFRKNSGQRVCMLEVVFEGILQVEDAEVFKETLSTGIGREKAYGMGLLTIAGMEG